MNYKQKIETILEQALTEKTFSLEIVDKIKELKDGFDEAQMRIEDLEKQKNIYYDSLQESKKEANNLRERLTAFEQREAVILDKEKSLEKMQYELTFQKMRADEIKELFGVVFKNPTVLRTKMTGHLVESNQPGGYPQTYTTQDTEEETIKDK